jgi:hypothetical protein
LTHFPLPDEFYDDPRYDDVTDAGIALYARAASFSCKHLTDGFVSTTKLPVLTSAVESAPDELVRAGVWRRTRGGFQFAVWPEQCTRAYVEAKREAWRRRQEKHRSSEPVESRRDSQRDSRVSHALVTEGVTRESQSPVPVPVPKKTSSSLGGDTGRKRPATRLPEDWTPTDTHRAYAKQHHLSLDGELFKFRHHATANDRRQASWNAAFSTWLANATEYRQNRPQAAGGEWRRWAEQ